MIEKLPLTNKNAWINQRLFDYRPASTYEYFVKLSGGISAHLLSKNTVIEGIVITWGKNTFKGSMREHAYQLRYE